ncbi:MAG: hypothetical protein H6737_07000 [Alphaproteobacteria bacterium]|nr:hypothetical protein [Alphaproteobacteria bacterium]
MRALVPALVFLAACQAATDPCWTEENAPSRCIGAIAIEPGDGTTPTFSLEGTGAVVPDVLMVIEADGDGCGGGSNLWELSRIPEEAALQGIAYGEVPEGARERVNEFRSPDGSLIALELGQTYSATFVAKDRLSASGAGDADWTGVFVAGDPDSFASFSDACL